MRTFITALFLLAKNWKQPKFPSIGEWMKKLWWTHAMDYDSENNKLLTYETECILKAIHWVKQARHKRVHTVWFDIWSSRTGQTMLMEVTTVVSLGLGIGRKMNWEDVRKLFSVMKMFCVTVWAGTMHLYPFVPTHWMVYLRSVHPTLYKLYLKNQKARKRYNTLKKEKRSKKKKISNV